MQLKEIMTTDVTLTDPNSTLQAAASAMRDGDFGILPVGENDRLVGTLTDRDITVRAVAAGKDPTRTTVREAMSEGITYCFEDQSTDEAAAVMSRNQIRRLPILNRDKRLVGIVSLGDFAVDRGTIEEAAKALHNVSKG
jgi:CBS domain-containing protein